MVAVTMLVETLINGHKDQKTKLRMATFPCC